MSKTLTCWACIGAFILTFTGTPAAAEQHETIRVERIEPDGVLTYMPSWRAPSAPHSLEGRRSAWPTSASSEDSRKTA
jgi:hypothetical protein